MPLPLLAVLPGILDIAGKVIDRVVPDKEAAEKARRELQSAENQQEFSLLIEQIKVNQEEAKSGNLFIAGWRPMVGWTCGMGLAYVALLEPVARFVAQVMFGYEGEFPVIDTSLTVQVLLGLLGLGGLRTLEKVKGAEGNR
jgi:hypothetical protein